MATIARLFRLREGEGRIVALMMSLTFVTFAGGAMAESGVNALFFERVGADSLPVLYLLEAGTVFLVMVGVTALLGRTDSRRAYLVLPLVLALLVLVERIALSTGARWLFFALWLTTSLAAVLQGLFAWGAAGLVTDTRQAKRLFPLFGAGGILGSVVGGLATRPVASAIGAENLLVVWIVALALAHALIRLVLSRSRVIRSEALPTRRRDESPVRALQEGVAFVRRSPLLMWMTAAAVLFSIMFYLLYLPYARAAAATYPDTEELAGFFGLFWAATTGVAFLISITATNRVLGRFGVTMAAVVFPLLYLGAFGIVSVSTTFITLVLVRFVLGVWLQAVASPAWESLINVTPMARRDQVRAFLNGGPTQVGTALAGVVGLIGERTLSTTQLSIVGIVLAALTLFLAWRIRTAYTGALVAALRAGRPLIFDRSPLRGSPITIENDAETLRVLAEASRDDDASVRRLAVSLLGESDGAAAVHRLRDAVRDPDPDVRRQAVEALGDASPATDGNAAIPSETMDDDDVAVAATAAALSLDGPDRDRALARLTNALAGDDEVAQSAALRALRHAPASDAADLAAPFLSHANPTLRDEALLVVSEVRPDRALPRAIEMLDRDGAHAPAAAAAAVQRANAAAVEPVLNILQAKPLTPVVLDVLSRLDARAQPSMVEAFVRDRTAIASRDRDLSAGIDDNDDVAGLLRDALLGRGRRHARAAFLALASISDDPDAIRASVDSLDAVDHGQVANALETLEAAIERGTARPLIALWEPEGRPGAETDVGAIERASQDEDELIRLCVESITGRAKGEVDVRTRQVSSMVERLLFLRKVAIFSQLDPADLHAIARAAEDHTFADGEHLADEGELGDRLHIIVSGAVRVVRHDGAMEIAQRGPGEVVGEMSLVSNEPRMATLIAVGDVRTVSLGRLEFQGIIRERPDVGLSVMKVLASRLTEAARPGSTTEEVA